MSAEGAHLRTFGAKTETESRSTSAAAAQYGALQLYVRLLATKTERRNQAEERTHRQTDRYPSTQN